MSILLLEKSRLIKRRVGGKDRNIDGQNCTGEDAQFFAFVRKYSICVNCQFMRFYVQLALLLYFPHYATWSAIVLLCYVLTFKSLLALQISFLVLVFGSFVVVLCCSAIPFTTPKCIQLLAVKQHCGCCCPCRRDNHHHNHCYFCRIVQDPIVLVLQLFLTILCVL